MGMAVAANAPKSNHPLTNYSFNALSFRPSYSPNVVGYNPVKMFALMPNSGKDSYLGLAGNYSGLEKRAGDVGGSKYAPPVHPEQMQLLQSLAGNSPDGNNYGLLLQIYFPLDSAIAPYNHGKSKKYH